MNLEEKVKKIEEDLQNLRENFDGAVYEDLGDGYQTNRIHILKKKVEEIFKTIHGIEPSEVDTVKQEIAELQKEVKNKYNQLLWIKMIPYREWFWNLKNTTDKQINSLKDNVDSNRGQINANLEIVLQDHLKSHLVVAREQLTDKDKLTIFREFDEAIQKQLEKLDSHIKVTISRNDGEKDENSKDVISSKENNLSAPERRIDGDSKPQTWRGEVPLVYANEKKGDFDREKDGGSEFSVTITPSGVLNASKIILPKIIENGLKEMEKDGENSVPNGETVSLEKPPMDKRGKPHCSLQNSTPSKEYKTIQKSNYPTCYPEPKKPTPSSFRIRAYDDWSKYTKEQLKLLEAKEPTDDMANITQIIEIYDNGHEHEFYPDTHVVVKKADLEKWNTFLTTLQKKVIPPFEPPEITDETRDWMIFACDEIRHEIMKYLGEEK